MVIIINNSNPLTNFSNVIIPVTPVADNGGENEGGGSSVADQYNPGWFYSYLPYRIFITYFLETTCPLVLTAFGLVSNVVNLIVFRRQGLLVDSSTSSLVGLTISDFFNCLTRFISTALVTYYVTDFVGQRKYAPPEVRNPATISIFFTPASFWFTTVTCWLTVYIGLERTVSVTFPFRVKRIFTAKRSYIAVVFIFTAGFLLHFPEFAAFKIIKIIIFNGDVFYHRTASGLIGWIPLQRMFSVNFLYIRPLSIFFVIVLNIVIVIQVRLSSRFRRSKSKSINDNSKNTMAPKSMEDENKSQKTDKTATRNSSKEDKLTKMMVFLSAFLVFCMSPGIVFMALSYSKVDMSYQIPLYVAWVLQNFMIVLEAANSAFNIFFYYTMSGKYRKDLLQLCGRSKH